MRMLWVLVLFPLFLSASPTKIEVCVGFANGKAATDTYLGIKEEGAKEFSYISVEKDFLPGVHSGGHIYKGRAVRLVKGDPMTTSYALSLMYHVLPGKPTPPPKGILEINGQKSNTFQTSSSRGSSIDKPYGYVGLGPCGIAEF